MKIVVPVLGLENAGKSTLIDALIGGEYTQTSASVCTKSAYHFILWPEKEAHDANIDFESVNAISEKIKGVNATLPNDLKRHDFNILSRAPLCKEMMDGVKIDIVDLPGWEEISVSSLETVSSPEKTKATRKQKASNSSPSTITSCPAKDFVSSEWDCFGCILVVLDVMRTNQEARELNCKLLQYLATLNKDKNIDIIVVGNKSDEDDSSKTATLTMKADIDSISGLNADFVALSAKSALFYRYAQGHELETFEKQNSRLVMKKIKDAIFKHRERKNKKVTDIFDELCKDAGTQLSSACSNFDALLKILERKIGGATRQKDIVKRSIELRLKRIEVTKTDVFSFKREAVWVNKVVEISKELWLIGAFEQDVLEERILKLHEEHFKTAIENFKEYPLDVWPLSLAAGFLLDAISTRIKWNNPSKWSQAIVERRSKIVGEYFIVFRQKFVAFTKTKNYRPSKKQKIEKPTAIAGQHALTWNQLTAHDWEQMFDALINEVPNFRTHFPDMGRFIAHNQSHKEDWGLTDDDWTISRDFTKGIYDEITCMFKPNNIQKYQQHAKLPILERGLEVNDINHWGNVPQVCFKMARSSNDRN